MADLDIEKISNAVTNVVTGYVTTFFDFLVRPKTTVAQALAAEGSAPIQGALQYAAISLLLGLSIASFLKLPGSKGLELPQTVFAVLFFWLIVSAFVHGVLRLVRIQGSIARTTTAFLYAVATIHPLWVLATSLAAPLITDTNVTLTYEYVIFVGDAPSRRESFVAEHEPEKDKTVLPPVAPGNSFPFALPGKRLPINESPWPKPKREVSFSWNNMAFYLGAGFLVVSGAYLAAGLSGAHAVAAWRLALLMALLTPVAVALLFIGLVLMWRM